MKNYFNLKGYHFLNDYRLLKEPTNLVTMQASIKLFNKLVAEIPKKVVEFPIIQEQYQTLGNRSNNLLIILTNLLKYLMFLIQTFHRKI